MDLKKVRQGFRKISAFGGDAASKKRENGFFPGKIRRAEFHEVLVDLERYYDILVDFLLIFLKISISFAASSWAVLEHSNLSTWHPPLYPFKTAIPIAVLLLLLQQIATFLDDLLVLLKLKNGRERESDDRA